MAVPISVRDPQLLGERQSNRLFLSWRGKPIDAHALGDLVKRHAALAKIKKHVTPHIWRHSCATHLVKNNANLRHVQDLLGHHSLATTERYLLSLISNRPTAASIPARSSKKEGCPAPVKAHNQAR